MKHIKALLFLILVSTSIFGQRDTIGEPMTYPKYALGFSPSALINYYNGLQVSNEFGLSPKFSVGIETAYIFSSIYEGTCYGIRMKLGGEFIITNWRKAGIYSGFNFLWRASREKRSLISIYFLDSYTETVYYKRIKHLLGGELTSGLIFLLNNDMRLQIGGGIGLGEMNSKDKDFTTSRTDEINEENLGSSFILLDRPGKLLYPILSFHINLSIPLTIEK